MKNNSRISLVLVAAALALCACVIPAMDEGVSALVVKPKQFFYPLDYVFVPEAELDVSAVSATGRARAVPVGDTRVEFDNTFHITGEKRGSVAYKGKREQFVVVVYDPAVGPPRPEGPVIVVE